MDTTGGALSFEATLQYQDLRQSVAEIERRIKGMTTTVVNETEKIDQQFKKLGQLAAGYFSLNALSNFSQQLVKVRGEYQQLSIAFTTLLGSKDKADAFLRQGVEFAAKTPFELSEVAQAQKLLLAYGFNVKTIIPTLTKLGDIASGTSSSLQELVAAYGQIRTQGTAQWDDVNKFLERGVNLIPELSRNLKIAEGDVKQFVADGKVGFKDIEKAIADLTNGQGKLNFGGLMAEQAKSLTGLTSNLSDAYDKMLNQIGEGNEGILAATIKGATGLVENYEEIVKVLQVLVATYGAYKAALVATAVIQTATSATNIANITAWFSLAKGIRSASEAQALFNLTVKANPYILALTAIVAVTTAIIVYKKELTDLEQAEQSIKSAREEASKGADSEKAKIELLTDTINNEKLSREARTEALKKLIALAPQNLSNLTLENIRTNEGTTAIDNYVEALSRKIEKQRIDAELFEHLSKRNEALKNKLEPGLVSQVITSIGVSEGAYDGNIEKARADKKAQYNNEVAQSEQKIIDKLKAENKTIDESAQATVTAGETKKKVHAVTVQQIEEEIKNQKALLSLNNSDAVNAGINKEIAKLEAQKRRLTGELTSSQKKAAADAAKSGPFGSIDYYEQVSRKASEILEKLGPKDEAKIAKQSQIKFDADQKVEQLRKQYAVKSFDEELADKRSKYELYQQWVSAYGKDAADNQFAVLLKSGQSYLDYLNAQIAQLESKRTADKPLNEVDAKNLGVLTGQRDDVTGKKTAIDLFNESLQQAQKESGNLAQYLVILKQKQDDLGKVKPISKDDFDIRRQLAEEVVATQAELQTRLQQFLTSFASSGEQQLAIQKDFAEKRAALDQRYNGQKGAEYKQALGVIDAAEKEALQEYQQRKLEESDAYKETNKVILAEGEKRQKIEIDRQKKVVEEAKKQFGINSEVYKKALATLTSIEVQAGGTGTQKVLGQYGTIFNQLGQSLSQLDGEAGKAGQALLGLASNLGQVALALKEGTSKSDLYGIAIQGVVGLIGDITNGIAARKKAEDDYYASVISQQQRYNLLLNEQLGIQTKNSENVFVKNYIGELEDSFKQYDDAQLKYQEALKKLNEGRAKEGLKTEFDGSSFLSSVGKGAATGAAIGTILGPGIGNVVGALVGGIVGGISSIFGGATKKADEFGALLERYPNLIQKAADGTDTLNTALAQSLLDSNQLDDKTKELVQTTIEWQKQVESTRDAIKSIVADLVGPLGDKLRDSLVNAFKEGTDAAKAFNAVLNDVIEDFVTKLLYSKIFTPFFDKLEKEITASLDTGNGGDGNIIDDLQRFQDYSKGGVEALNKGLQQLKDYSSSMGFDILQKTKSTTSNPNSGGQAIQGVTESTANILNGQVNAIRIGQADIASSMRQTLLSLNNIDRNTARIEKTNDLLDSVDRSLRTLAANPTRGLGQPG